MAKRYTGAVCRLYADVKVLNYFLKGERCYTGKWVWSVASMLPVSTARAEKAFRVRLAVEREAEGSPLLRYFGKPVPQIF